jgi:hypothetical protein
MQKVVVYDRMRTIFIAATSVTTCKILKYMHRRFTAHNMHLQLISTGI